MNESRKYCVLVLCVGDIDYKDYSVEILSHYFKKHNIPYYFIENIPDTIDCRNSHPSWWKLLGHTIIPNYDFIICWDLDLLPRSSDIEVIKDFDMSKLCLAWDSCAKYHPNDKFMESFKYNGGLIGIPKEYSEFTEGVFNKFAPGVYPSYEQYYLNEEIYINNIPIYELPEDINVLHSYKDFKSARLQHYTSNEFAKSCIALHHEMYFNIKCNGIEIKDTSKPILYDTRIDMISSLVSKGSKICEVGIFKGDMAKQIEPIVNPELFVLIDYFDGVTGSGDQDGNNFEFADLNISYEHLTNYFKDNQSVKLIKGDSVNSMKLYADETFDMIYLDGDHSYNGCKRDLITAFKKIKMGGYIMGHDYQMNHNKTDKQYTFGVKNAVDAFCSIYKQRICAKALDGCVSYAIKKE